MPSALATSPGHRRSPASRFPVLATGPVRALLALLVPQLALGGYLLGVPDRVSLPAAEIATLAHVVSAAVALPLLAWLVYRHARASTGARRKGSSTSRWQLGASWALVATLAAACTTGIAALSSGRGMPVATGHAIAAVVLACVLPLHVALTGRRAEVAIVITSFAAPLGIGLLMRARGSEALPTPAFAYVTRPANLYDPAHWCGECHTEVYAEWHRSAHARTLGIPKVKRQLGAHASILALDLASFGKIAAHAPGPEGHGKLDGAFAFESCTQCHSPTSFYGDDPTDPLTSLPPSRDGVTCSFCHTLRDVRPAGDLEATVQAARARGQVDPAAVIADIPFYVSAPETVRRYFGQGSRAPFLREVGNLLVRWRPDVHRADYRAPLLDRSEVCSSCHGNAANARELPVRSYPDWATSAYNTGAVATTVRCQDCHMSSTFAPRRVDTPGSLVPWGPVRARRASHLFIGGNVDAANVFGDTDMAAREHAINREAVSLRAALVGVSDGRARVSVVVRNTNVGHLFPAVESNLRYAWIKLRVLDASGRDLGQTADPTEDRLAESESPILFRCLDPEFRVSCDSAVPPGGERTFDASVAFRDGVPRRIAIEVRHTIDPEPIAALALDVVPPRR